MSILNKGSNKNADKTTKGMWFGTPQAEGECIEEKGHRINPYVTDYLNILNEIANNKFLIVGRKGTGKSAIAQYIVTECEKSEGESYAQPIPVSTVTIERIIQFTNSKDGESLVYEWLILLYLTKLLVKCGSAKYSQAISKLSKFLSKNTGSVDIDQKQMLEIMETRQGHIDISMLTEKYQHIWGSSKTLTNPPFVNILTPLKETIQTALKYQDLKGKEFFVLFDDLDVDFELSNEEHCKRLMNLIRTVSSLNNTFPAKVKILLFLRDDMISHLAPKYNDSAKIIESHKVVINWYVHNLNKLKEDDVPIKNLVNKRIKKAFQKRGVSIPQNKTPWDYLIDDNIGHPKSSFKYLLDYTFYRPRDFVLLLNTISDDAYRYPLDENDVEKVLNSYCNKLKTEILSELTLYFNDKEKQAIYNFVFQHIANDIKNGKEIASSELAAYIDRLKIFSKKGEEVIKILWRYSLIGYSDQEGNVYYNHREEYYPGSTANAIIELPGCIRRLYKI